MMTVLVEQLGWVLIHSLWQFTLLGFFAGLAAQALRRRSAAYRYGVLVAAMATIVLIPVGMWAFQLSRTTESDPVSLAALIQVPESAAANRNYEALSNGGQSLEFTQHSAVHGEPRAARNSPIDQSSNASPEMIDDSSERPHSWSVSLQTSLRPWLAWSVAAWGVGVILCSLRPLLGWHTLRRLRQIGLSPASLEVGLMLRRISERLGLGHSVAVWYSTLAQVPVVVGYFKPAILLPISMMSSLPSAQLEAILAHELAHVWRHDFIVNLIQTLVETVFFYHPAVWWISWQIRVEREHCCDDIVVALLDNRVEYGRALLAVEVLRGGSTLLAPGAADGSLVSRIHRLAMGPVTRSTRMDWWCVNLCLLLIVIAGFTTALLSRLDLLDSPVSSSSDDSSTVGPSGFLAEFPNGVKIDFIGLAPMEADPKQWWRPDGTQLNPTPSLRREQQGIYRDGSREVRRALFHVFGADDQGSIRAMSGQAFSEKLSSGESFISYSGGLTFANGQRSTTLRICVSTEPLSPVRILEANGQRRPRADVSAIDPVAGDINVTRVRRMDGGMKKVNGEFVPQTETELTYEVPTAWRQPDLRIVAIDKAGQSHESSGGGGTFPTSATWKSAGQSQGFVFFPLPPEQIDRFEYRFRILRHRAIFENVSGALGNATSVKVQTESSSCSDAEAIAGQFKTSLSQLKLPFLDPAKEDNLWAELHASISKHAPRPLSHLRRRQLLKGTMDFVKREFDPAEKDHLYLEFRNRFETLKWELTIALARAELTSVRTDRIAAQRKWMRAEVTKLPEMPEFQRWHKEQLDKLESLFDDPLNPFFQEPFTDSEFERFQSTFKKRVTSHGSNMVLLQVCPFMMQAAIDVLRDKLMPENIGYARQDTRFSLNATPPQVGNTSLHIEDFHSSTRRRDLYVDVMRNIFVSAEAPADVALHSVWLQQQGQGDLAFDGRSDSLLGVRGAKLAVLNANDWMSSDQVSLADLRKLIATTGKSNIAFSIFVEYSGDPAHGILRLRANTPSLVIQTQEDKISVIRIRDVAGGSPVIVSRPRSMESK